MTKTIKRQHSAEFKVKVVLELLKQEESSSQICSRYAIHPTQARKWKQQALLNLQHSFSGKTIQNRLKEKDGLIEELYAQIGKLKYELDWLKKKMGFIQ